MFLDRFWDDLFIFWVYFAFKETIKIKIRSNFYSSAAAVVYFKGLNEIYKDSNINRFIIMYEGSNVPLKELYYISTTFFKKPVYIVSKLTYF